MALADKLGLEILRFGIENGGPVGGGVRGVAVGHVQDHVLGRVETPARATVAHVIAQHLQVVLGRIGKLGKRQFHGPEQAHIIGLAGNVHGGELAEAVAEHFMLEVVFGLRGRGSVVPDAHESGIEFFEDAREQVQLDVVGFEKVIERVNHDDGFLVARTPQQAGQVHEGRVVQLSDAGEESSHAGVEPREPNDRLKVVEDNRANLLKRVRKVLTHESNPVLMLVVLDDGELGRAAVHNGHGEQLGEARIRKHLWVWDVDGIFVGRRRHFLAAFLGLPSTSMSANKRLRGEGLRRRIGAGREGMGKRHLRQMEARQMMRRV